MSILTILLVILVVGVLLWLINAYIPMQSTIKSILNAVVVILLVVWLLDAFGLIDVLRNTQVGT
ncbi:MAG: Thivi_2564 family membrane protein [Sphingomicrobium sp.]